MCCVFRQLKIILFGKKQYIWMKWWNICEIRWFKQLVSMYRVDIGSYPLPECNLPGIPWNARHSLQDFIFHQATSSCFRNFLKSLKIVVLIIWFGDEILTGITNVVKIPARLIEFLWIVKANKSKQHISVWEWIGKDFYYCKCSRGCSIHKFCGKNF